MIKILRISLAGLCLLITWLAAHAQSLNDSMVVVNGTVRVLAGNSSTIYLGGDFYQVGPKTGSGIIVDPTTGRQIGNLKSYVNHDVHAVVPDGSGGWYIGGRFTTVGGAPHRALAHVFADGSVDPGFDVNFDNLNGTLLIYSLCIVNNRLYAGGYFSSVNGISRSNLAAIDLPSKQVVDWHPVVPGKVASIIAAGNTVFVGGSFNFIDGLDRKNLAAFDITTGKLTDWNPRVNGDVNSMTLDGNSMYIGGHFYAVGDQPREKIAQIDLTTGNATDFALSITSNGNPPYVNAILVHRNILYIGGYFDAIGGEERKYLASADVTTGTLTDWNPTPLAIIQTIAAYENTVFVGASFINPATQSHVGVGAYDAATGALKDWNPPVSAGGVLAFSPTKHGVYIGGNAYSFNGQPRACVAAIDAVTGQLKDWNPRFNRRVYAIATAGDMVYVGGTIRFDGVPDGGLMAVQATTGQIVSSFPATDLEVYALTVSGNILYVGGNFTTIGGQRRRGLAAIDIRSGLVTGWNPDCSGNVKTIAVREGTIYVGGYFSQIGGKDRDGLAAIDAITGQVTDWNPDLDLYVSTLAARGATVYAGGMPQSGPDNAKEKQTLFALDAVTGARLDWNPKTDFYAVEGLAFQGKNIYVGGQTFDYASPFSMRILGIDTQTGQISSNLRTDYRVLALASQGNSLYAGGDFKDLLVGGRQFFHPCLAKFTTTSNLIEGTIFNDSNADCVKGDNEKGLKQIIVVAEPGDYFGVTDDSGKYTIVADTGIYTVKQVLPPADAYSSITQVCPASPPTHTVSFKNYGNTVAGKDFGNQVVLRPYLTASVASTRRRRCMVSITTLSYCNTGYAVADDVKVHLKLPDHVVLVGTDAPYTVEQDKHYVFSVGKLDAGQCGTIQIQDSVVCNNPDIRGLTQCTRVWLTPANVTAPAPNWDKSDITLKARCGNNGVVRLGIYNTGTGNMADSAAFRILLDARLALQSKFKLAAGDSLILRVPANGRTVRLEADQRPDHPVKKSANITLEACGTNAEGKVSLGYVAQLPPDDPEPEVAEECLPITDSYDPNDKLVLPTGTTEERYTPTGTALSYTVRFQNTGNDYAYKVVVVDTLSAELDISTLQIGAVSHPYTVGVSGKGRPVLTFTFDDINLPDSTRDQAGSNGFIQFRIKPRAGLPAKTPVENFADIYFDYNPPIRTNTVINRIYDVPPLIAPSARLEVSTVVATPIITGFTPASGAAGTVVTLTGAHFDPVPGNNQVTFNGIAATVTGSTGATLTVTVPAGEAAGKIRVITPDGAAVSATDFSLTPTAAGQYLPDQAVRVYPNPAPGRFVVQFDAPVNGVIEMTVLDARGRRVKTIPLAGKSAQREEISLAGHGAGIYLVLIRTQTGLITRKVVLK